MAEVIIKRIQFVEPAEPTFNGIIPLTELDQLYSYIYLPWVYLYKRSSKSSNDISTTFRDSLSRTLVHFYPFAGRIICHKTMTANNNPFGIGSMELLCGGGDGGGGAVLIEAESSNKLEDLRDFSELSKLGKLIPEYDRSPMMLDKIPLLQVQITMFQCGGYSLGILMSHGVVDGLSATHFLKEWARIASGESIETSPFIDRSILGATKLLSKPQTYDERQTQAHTSKEDVKETKIQQLTREILTLSKAQVQNLKKIATGPHEDNNSRPYTRYEVVTAYIWRCISKTMGYDDQSPTPMSLAIAVDIRGRIQPPLPSQYFGNAALSIAATSTTRKIISHPLPSTCETLRRTINHVTDEYIRSFIEDMKTSKSITTPKDEVITSDIHHSKVRMDVCVVSWLGLPLYGLDFGWGKEMCMRPLLDECEGTIVIMPGQDNEEQGQVNLLVCLKKDQFDNFKHHFYQDIASCHLMSINSCSCITK